MASRVRRLSVTIPTALMDRLEAVCVRERRNHSNMATLVLEAGLPRFEPGSWSDAVNSTTFIKVPSE